MPTTEYEVEIVSLDRASAIEHDWEQLALHAVELNPFYEPWMLLPAVRALGMSSEVQVALIWHRNPANPKRQLLTGLLPFTSNRRWRGLPVATVEGLTHSYCFFGVPLLHREHAKLTLDAYFDWLSLPASGLKATAFRLLPLDGPFHQLLVDVLHSRSLVSSVERRYTRALYRRPTCPQEYIANQFSGRTLKHLRRQKELLSEQGKLEIRHLDPGDNVSDWVDAFLRLEAKGWKGVAGTALGSMKSHTAFFREITQTAWDRHSLNMSGLWLDGSVIAARTSFQAGETSYLFKIAYDEGYAKYSPGMLLEMECILAGVRSGNDWEDSCTSADNQVYKRLWRDRRTIEDIAVSSGSASGDFFLSVLPCLRFVKSWWRRLSTSSRSATDQGMPAKGSAGSRKRNSEIPNRQRPKT